jgi:hypothetical protein
MICGSQSASALPNFGYVPQWHGSFRIAPQLPFQTDSALPDIGLSAAAGSATAFNLCAVGAYCFGLLTEVNVGSADRYRKQADEARWMAAHALKPESKTVWLRIADVWSVLAHQADENDERQELQRAEDSN